jgi:hypothetical protein
MNMNMGMNIDTEVNKDMDMDANTDINMNMNPGTGHGCQKNTSSKIPSGHNYGYPLKLISESWYSLNCVI